MSDSHLTPGTRARWRVIGHHSYGLDVELVGQEDIQAVVDIIFTGLPAPIEPLDDYPAIGTEVDGVIQLRTPSGQLRVTMCPEDLTEASG